MTNTPGPWVFEHRSVRSYISAPTVLDPYHALTRGPHREDDARLIAAAPEMLALLNEIAAWGDGPEVNGGFDCPGHARAAREAIAKATGTEVSA